MKNNILKQGLTCFISGLILLAPFGDALAKGNERETLSGSLEARIAKKDVVLSVKAKDGGRVELLQNPKDHDAGLPVPAIVAAVAGAYIVIKEINSIAETLNLAADILAITNSEKTPSEKRQMFSVLVAKHGVDALVHKALPWLPITTDEVITALSPDLLFSQKVFEITKGITGNILDVSGIIGLTDKAIAVITGESLNLPPTFREIGDSLTDATRSIPSANILVTNPVDNTPQTISFSETFSGFNSATPDYDGSPNSTLTFSELTGERTGVLQGGLIQYMDGRFEAYEGSANTLVGVPISGRVTGIGIFIHGRPISAQAMLSMEGIGDFRTAMGPFTINPNGTSAGTFLGNTFNYIDNTPTGDVVLNYSAYPQ
jgi:hypothetical protein